MSGHRATLGVVLVTNLCGCGTATGPANNAQAATPPVATPVAPAVETGRSEWEATATLAELHLPHVPAEVQRQIRAATERPRVERVCERLLPPVVGDPMNGMPDCVYTAVRDSGERVDRTLACRARRGPRTLTITGTRTADSYEYRIVMREDARPDAYVVSREVGRRLGPCPDTP